MRVKVLGVNIDDITIDQAVDIVGRWLKEKNIAKRKKHYLVTTNPEFIMTAQKDPQFKKILNDADLSIPDGMGLKITGKIKIRISGTDLMEKLVDKSRDWAATIGFLGGRDGVAQKVAECLRKKYPGMRVVFAESGGDVDNSGNVIARSETTKQSSLRLPRPFGARNDRGVDLLFVAFGHPKQEKWIYQNLPKLPVKVAMGVGGAFDYISGRVPRAPKGLRGLGLEWLFRLIIQPWRIKRQLSLIKYLLLLLNQK